MYLITVCSIRKWIYSFRSDFLFGLEKELSQVKSGNLLENVHYDIIYVKFSLKSWNMWLYAIKIFSLGQVFTKKIESILQICNKLEFLA